VLADYHYYRSFWLANFKVIYLNSMQKKLQNLIEKIFGQEVEVSLIHKKGFGDLSTNVVFSIAPLIKKDPQSVAIAIKNQLADFGEIDKVEVAGGFINLWLNGKYIVSQLKSGEGKPKIKSEKIQVEFVSANPTGPLTLGNARGAFYGDAIAKILAWAGHNVQREYLVNDTGGQVEKLGQTVLDPSKTFYSGDYIRKYQEQFKGQKKSAQKIGRITAGAIMDDFIKPALCNAQVKFDNFKSQFELDKKYSPDDLIKKLRSQNYIQEKDGAIWFLSTKLGDDKDRVLKKKTGEWTYFSGDGLYLLDREKRGFEKIIMIWGPDHHGYVNRVKALAVALGWKKENVSILIYQLVNLKKGDKVFRMSKRAGNAIYFDEFIKKVGLDASRYFFLEKNPGTHLEFDTSVAMKKDLTNPVYYLQYALVRAKKIIVNCASKKTQKSELTDSGRELAIKIWQIDDELLRIAKTLEVSKIPHLTLDICRAFHNFYEKDKVIESGIVNETNLLVIRKFIEKLELLFDLMGISKPEKM